MSSWFVQTLFKPRSGVVRSSVEPCTSTWDRPVNSQSQLNLILHPLRERKIAFGYPQDIASVPFWREVILINVRNGSPGDLGTKIRIFLISIELADKSA